MALPELSPRPPRRRKATALFLLVVLFLGSFFFVLTNLEGIQRFLRGIPDNAWALSATQADRLHAQGLTGAGVIVCVVDSGVDLTHPDLREAHLAAWRDYVRGHEEPYDDNGHGTRMVGLIAGRGLVRGFAPGASLVVVKAIDDQGVGNTPDIVQAIVFCMDPFGNGTKSHIISLSLGGAGGQSPGGPVSTQANEAIRQGVLVVAAAGNAGPEAPDVQTPASADLVIAVGAVDARLRISSISQGGNNAARSDPNRKPELVAPGEGLATTSRDGAYVSVLGTSVASAVVSAILALVLQGEPTLRSLASASGVEAVKAALMGTARPLAGQAEPHDPFYGYGLVQGLDLLNALRIAPGMAG